MKTFFCIVFLSLLTATIGQGQKCSITVSGFNQKSNIAYLGVDNKIEIDLALGLKSLIELKTDNGKVSLDSYSYDYRPASIGSASMEVFLVKDGKNELFQTCEILVKYLPFTFEIGSHSTYLNNNIIFKKSEFQYTYFSLNSTNTNLSARAKILSFDLKVKRQGQTLFKSKYSEYNLRVHEQIIKDLEMIQPGDVVYIHNLKYTYLNDHVIGHRPVSITIK